MPHEHVCPWWIGYLLASPIRRLFQKPEVILGPFVAPGMRLLEVGPGMGFFTLPMARMVGTEGKVVAVDIQERMLAELARRAARAELGARIECRKARAESLDITDLQGSIDFTLLMAVVHEIPDAKSLFGQIAAAMKPGGKVLLAEPAGHVSRQAFDQTLALGRQTGFTVELGPAIWHSLSAVLVRS